MQRETAKPVDTQELKSILEQNYGSPKDATQYSPSPGTEKFAASLYSKGWLKVSIGVAARKLGIQIDLDASDAKTGLRDAMKEFKKLAERRMRALEKAVSFYGSASDWTVDTVSKAIAEEKISPKELKTFLAYEHLRLLKEGRFEAANRFAARFKAKNYFKPNLRDVQAAMRLWARHGAYWSEPDETLKKID